MPTLKSEFQELAVELINDEFADFKRDFSIKKNVGYDPISDTETTFIANTGATPIDIKTAEQVFSNVTAEDIYLVILNDSIVPNDFNASYYCEYDGLEYQIVDVQADPADAAYFIRIVI